VTARALAGFAVGLGLGLASRGVRLRPASGTVLITGGSRGLGLLLAREYLRRGARVAICARDAAELERAKDALDGSGQPILAVPCDVTERTQVAELVAMVRQHFGSIDTLVNNAGVIQVGPAEHMSAADYERAMRVHFWAPFWTAEAVLPEMRERCQGRIVNISSIAGMVPVPHMLPYTASKFALVGWSEGLRAELAKHGIAVTTVCPALIRTGSPRNAEFKGRHRAEYTWFSIADSLPLLSMDAERAARRIVRGAEQGRARILVPLMVHVPVIAHAVVPGLAHGVLSLMDRLLPRAGGVGAASREGRDSGTRWSPSWLTVLNERAARRNNEVAP
jgi:NAD(P)-dependent dehydrogenase (short-subunit alcohol dehydrogenase family)